LGDGTLKGGSPLHPVTEAKRIRARNGHQRVLDGPFAESKEVIAGYFLIEAPDIDTAVAIAARCPNAECGSGEGRESVAMGGTSSCSSGPGLLRPARRHRPAPRTTWRRRQRGTGGCGAGGCCARSACPRTAPLSCVHAWSYGQVGRPPRSGWALAGDA